MIRTGGAARLHGSSQQPPPPADAADRWDDKWHLRAKGLLPKITYLEVTYYMVQSVLVIRPHWNITKRLCHDFSKGQTQTEHYVTAWNSLTKLCDWIAKGGWKLRLPNAAADPVLLDIYPKLIETGCKSGRCCCRRKRWTPRSDEQKLDELRGVADGWHVAVLYQSGKQLLLGSLLQREATGGCGAMR